MESRRNVCVNLQQQLDTALTKHCEQVKHGEEREALLVQQSAQQSQLRDKARILKSPHSRDFVVHVVGH